LRGEIKRLVTLTAQGIASDSVGTAINEREVQIARLEVKLRQPRKVAPNIEKLREALTQRAAEWWEMGAPLRAEGGAAAPAEAHWPAGAGGRESEPELRGGRHRGEACVVGGFTRGRKIGVPNGTRALRIPGEACAAASSLILRFWFRRRWRLGDCYLSFRDGGASRQKFRQRTSPLHILPALRCDRHQPILIDRQQVVTP
jgi:hypothetical protein